MTDDSQTRRSPTTWILFGVAIGTALGVALDNVAIGAGVGFVFAAGGLVGRSS